MILQRVRSLTRMNLVIALPPPCHALAVLICLVLVAPTTALAAETPASIAEAWRHPAWRAGVTRVLLVTGLEYPGHPWRQTAPALAEGLEKDSRLQVQILDDPYQLAKISLTPFGVIVLHFMNWHTNGPNKAARENLRQAVASGKGLALVHFACGAWQDWPEFRNLAGRVWTPSAAGMTLGASSWSRWPSRSTRL